MGGIFISYRREDSGPSGMRFCWTAGQGAEGRLRDGHQVPSAVSKRIDRNPEGADLVGTVTGAEYPRAARAAVEVEAVNA